MTLSQRPLAWIAAIKATLDKTTASWDVLDLSAGLTLILLILIHTDTDWYVRSPILVLCIAAIIHRPLYRRASFWLVLAIILAVKHYAIWYATANHEYLINYWCLALGLSFLTADPRRAIAINARLLIGLAFLFGVLWKVISVDFLDGRFIHYLLLSDDNFKYFAQWFGGLTPEALSQNYQAFTALLNSSTPAQAVQLQSTTHILWMSKALTWWTVLIEGLIAVSFLCPRNRLISRWRDFPLLIFLLTTFAIIPVVGFGWILAAMGIAQSSSTFRYTPLLYVLAFLLIELFSMPWMSVLARLFSGA